MICEELLPVVTPCLTLAVINTLFISLPLIDIPPSGKSLVYSILLPDEVTLIVFKVPALSPVLVTVNSKLTSSPSFYIFRRS